jgi:hypothetical protein
MATGNDAIIEDTVMQFMLRLYNEEQQQQSVSGQFMIVCEQSPLLEAVT